MDVAPVTPATLATQVATSIPSVGHYNEFSRDGDTQGTGGRREVAHHNMSVSVDSNTLASPTTVSNRSVDGAKGSELPALPHFIKPLPAYLDADDLRYLLKRGCFAFLTTELEKLVIRRYAEFIHPLIPVLDLDEFVGVVCGNSKKKISLLLYHAIMCAGMAAVEIETILKYGFPSKPAARREQYTKAKVRWTLLS